MSIIYEALKKVEGQKEILAPESIPRGIAFPAENGEKKVSKNKKLFLLSIVILLIVLGLSVLLFILPRQEREQVQEQEIIAPVAVVEKREVDPARVYRIPESRNPASGEVILREGFVREYILEGIIYDPKAPFALINGRVVKESDEIDGFRIDKISKAKVEMTNTEDNSKITLSLP